MQALTQLNQFIRVIAERLETVDMHSCSSEAKCSLFWHCVLFAPAPFPFEILAGTLMFIQALQAFVTFNWSFLAPFI